MSNLNIQIPKPCHADWNDMTPNAQGKFCGSCQKTVVDFTNMSDEEVKNYFTQNYSSKVCGHFKYSQVTPSPNFFGNKLNRLYEYIEKTSRPYLLKTATLFILGSCMTFFGCVQHTSGQKSPVNNSNKPEKNEGRLMGDTTQMNQEDLQAPRLKGKVAMPK